MNGDPNVNGMTVALSTRSNPLSASESKPRTAYSYLARKENSNIDYRVQKTVE